jgi:hypothetical protein
MSNEEQVKSQSMSHNQILALRGLRLPVATLKSLQATGIYCRPSVSVEHQHLAGKYVLRGAESGGAVAELGAYCSFVDEAGQPISWLQRVDSIAVNGVHAIVVAPVLLRLQLVRVRHTYDLLISKYVLASVDGGKRPALQSSIMFYGRRGTLEMDLCGKDSSFTGMVRPLFFSRSGETAAIPAMFEGLRNLSCASRPLLAVLAAVTRICFSPDRPQVVWLSNLGIEKSCLEQK